MESPGKELLPQNFFVREQIKDILRSTDLTLIFNAHGTAEHAEASTEIIPPNSTVFVEGYSPQAGTNDSLHRLLQGYSTARCYYGKDSDDYQQAKQEVLDILTAYSFLPATEYSDFHVSQCRELITLIEKDCYVSFADYRQAGIPGEDSTLTAERNERFAEHHRLARSYPMFDYGRTHHSLARAIVAMHRSDESDYLAHFHREHFAVSNYIDDVRLIASLPFGNELTRTTAGKLQTYLIYGSAHRHSLPTRFKEWGADAVHVHAIDTFHDSRYIPADTKSYGNNFRRMMAMRAFQMLGAMLEQDDHPLGIERGVLYPALESVNDSAEDHTRLLCELLEIVDAGRIDANTARYKLLTTYQRIVDGNL